MIFEMNKKTFYQTNHIWRNDITGLRALAVLPVIFYHAFPNLVPGGFLGVDIFFVISGYLISGIIFRNIKQGTFSYLDFYSKRIKRIIPNLLLLFLFVLFLGYFVLFTDDYDNLGRHVYSSAIFIENFRLLSEVGYFTEDAVRKPLLHLWSLAIEEQFYIIFPILCVLIWKLNNSVKALGIFVFTITLLSLLFCFLCANKSFAFYFPLTRFWELGVGIVLAYTEIFQLFDPRRVAPLLRQIASSVGLLLIVFSVVFYKSTWQHPGFITFFPVLGAFLIILAQPDSLVNKYLLGCSVMTFIGLISYSLYLWHWPILSYLNICLPNPEYYFTLGAIALSSVLAILIYYFVENPIRRTNFCLCFDIGLLRIKLPTVILLIFCLILEGGCGYVLRKTEGLPNRSVNYEFPELVDIRKGVDWSKEPFVVINDVKIYGLSSGLPDIIFVGDSHAVQYYYRMKNLSRKYGHSAGMLQSSGCFMLTGMNNNECRKGSEIFYQLLKNKQVKKVVLVNKWGSRYNQDYFEEGIAKFKSALLDRKDLKVFVLLDPPWDEGTGGSHGNFDPLRHFNRFRPDAPRYMLTYSNNADWKFGNDAISAKLGNLSTIISVEGFVCPLGKCDVHKWYMDDDHLQPRRLEKEAFWIDKIFE